MFFKKKNKDTSVKLRYLDGINQYTKNSIVKLTLNDDTESLDINVMLDKKPEIHLKYNQIIAVDFLSKEEIKKKSRSVCGRAMVGGLLLGQLGAIIGGMSGIKDKQYTDYTFFAVINYKSSSGETKVLNFQVLDGSMGWNKFLKELNSKIKKECECEYKEVYL